VDEILPPFKPDRSIVDLNVNSAALCRAKGVKLDSIIDKKQSLSLDFPVPTTTADGKDKMYIRVWTFNGGKFVFFVRKTMTLRQFMMNVSSKIHEQLSEDTHEFYTSENLCDDALLDLASPSLSSSSIPDARVLELYLTLEETGVSQIGLRKKRKSISAVTYQPMGTVPNPSDFQFSTDVEFTDKSFNVKKQNRRGVSQDRIMLLTSSRIYNEIPNASDRSRKSRFFGSKRKFREIAYVVKTELADGEPRKFRVLFRDWDKNKIVTYQYEAETEIVAAEIVATIDFLVHRRQ